MCVVTAEMDQGCYDILDDEVVKHLWSKKKKKKKNSQELNDMQMKALRMAMRHKFSLIQGPPGEPQNSLLLQYISLLRMLHVNFWDTAVHEYQIITTVIQLTNYSSVLSELSQFSGIYVCHVIK